MDPAPPAAAKLLAVSVSTPTMITYNGKDVPTGIYNQPVSGPRMARRLNIDGDGQADLAAHGGVDKAVYAFPIEHYAFYRDRFSQVPSVDASIAYGYFGENLTTAGLVEREVRIGDRFQIGDALLEVSQPRSPCFKLGVKVGDRAVIKTMRESRFTGFYLRVVSEGVLEAGQTIDRVGRAADAPTVEEIHTLLFFDKSNPAELRRAVACEGLAREFRETFAERLASLEAGAP